MVPFCEKRRVYVIHLSCGCCPTFIGGMFHQSFHTTLIMFFSFPLNPNQSPRSNSTDWKRNFPRLITVVSVTKAHVSTRFAWRFPDLTVTLEQSKKKNFDTHHISHIINSYITHTLQCHVNMALHSIQKCLHNPQTQNQFNTPWTQIGIKYLTYLHPCRKYKSIWIVSDTFPTLTP